jgi:hypothetical protein
MKKIFIIIFGLLLISCEPINYDHSKIKKKNNDIKFKVKTNQISGTID